MFFDIMDFNPTELFFLFMKILIVVNKLYDNYLIRSF